MVFPHNSSLNTPASFTRSQAEQRVLSYMQEANRPFNVQNVADMLAQHGIKKPQVERSLVALAERGEVVCKVRTIGLRCCYGGVAILHNVCAGIWQGQDLHAATRQAGNAVQRGVFR